MSMRSAMWMLACILAIVVACGGPKRAKKSDTIAPGDVLELLVRIETKGEGAVESPDTTQDAVELVAGDGMDAVPSAADAIDICEPNCEGQECGVGGCGGTCGECEQGEWCNGSGICAPATCSIIVDCMETCESWDEVCHQECNDSAPPEVLEAYLALEVCTAVPPEPACDLLPSGSPEQEECWQLYFDQLFDTCSDEYYACWPPGDGTCVELYLCIVSCSNSGEGADNCLGNCYADASIEAIELWDEYWECLALSWECWPEVDELACQAAHNEFCKPSLLECAHGELTCEEILGCLEECKKEDQFSSLTCVVHGSIPAQEHYGILEACLEAECGEEPGEDCLDVAVSGPCAAEHSACLSCLADCDGKECGTDGCGGICGTCYPGFACLAGGICESPPVDCKDKECGDDGWGGSCGECQPDEWCDAGQCTPCGSGQYFSPENDECTECPEDKCDLPWSPSSPFDHQCGPANCPPGCLDVGLGPCSQKSDCPDAQWCNVFTKQCVNCLACGACPPQMTGCDDSLEDDPEVYMCE